MPTFFFDVHDGGCTSHDDEGCTLPDREAARREALGLLPNIARDELPDGDQRNFIVDVRDQAGAVIFTATLSLVAHWVDREELWAGSRRV